MADSFGSYASLPSAVTAGAGSKHRTTDSYYDQIVSDGANWRYTIGGAGVKPVDNSNFAWFNQGTASYAQQGGAIVLTNPPGDAGLDLAVRAEPVPTSDFQVTSLMFLNEAGQGDAGGGPLFYESSSGRSISTGLGGGGGNRFNAIRYLSLTNKTGLSVVHDLDVRVAMAGNYLWTRQRFQGGQLSWYFSGDGVDFLPLASEAASGHFTSGGPTHIGFAADGANATYSTLITVVSWKVELLGGVARHYSIARLPRLRSGR